MHAKPGDHVCAIYSSPAELAQRAAAFLAAGLATGERCWYVASGNEGRAVQAALAALDVDVDAETARGALGVIAAPNAYVIHGAFDPEITMGIFNDAIEQAWTDGFTGFRAAADMTWALEHEDGTHLLIVYEALLSSLFVSCRATGLCLYDRHRMPLSVINGALDTHPLVIAPGGALVANDFYDATVDRLASAPDALVLAKLAGLGDRRES